MPDETGGVGLDQPSSAHPRPMTASINREREYGQKRGLPGAKAPPARRHFLR